MINGYALTGMFVFLLSERPKGAAYWQIPKAWQFKEERGTQCPGKKGGIIYVWNLY